MNLNFQFGRREKVLCTLTITKGEQKIDIKQRMLVSTFKNNRVFPHLIFKFFIPNRDFRPS